MRVSKKEAILTMEAIKQVTSATLIYLQNLDKDDFEVEAERIPGGPDLPGIHIFTPCAAPPPAVDCFRFAALAVLWGKLVGLHAPK